MAAYFEHLHHVVAHFIPSQSLPALYHFLILVMVLLALVQACQFVRKDHNFIIAL